MKKGKQDAYSLEARDRRDIYRLNLPIQTMETAREKLPELGFKSLSHFTTIAISFYLRTVTQGDQDPK